ncbi:MAG: hypothetical protein IK103_05350 [Bacteroidales bacterium]|nr:hypothetical protein [Bacteroidales bacterium]
MKKKILFLLAIIFCNAGIYAQNAVHFAFDTNGPMGECLFPQDARGQVSYTGIVEVSGSASEIMDALLDYVATQKVKIGFDFKEQAKSPKSCVFSIKCPVGKQLRSITVMGSPVYSALKDASEISFTCLLEVLDGKFKYTLKDFVTKRNMLPGEAKNDGSPNIIHWQRVNSLIKERDLYLAKHNPEKRSTREEMYEYDSKIKFEHTLYVEENKKVNQFVKGLESLKIDKGSDFELDIEAKIYEKEDEYEVLDLSGYRGNLLEKGNSVFVCGDEIYEMAGAAELVKQISIDSLWNTVTFPEQAHFIIEYHVNTVGSDKAYIVVRSRDGKISYTSPKRSTSESFEDNRWQANSFYKNLYSKIKRLEEGKGDRDLEKFIIK